MTIDVLFLAKNRLEFTRQALRALLANTNWGLVRHFIVVDDCSADGTEELIDDLIWKGRAIALEGFRVPIGSPAAAMNRYIEICGREVDAFAKVDNDTIVPPGWLDQCAAVMESHPEIDLLGIEPPESRVPHFAGGKRNPQPEFQPHLCHWNQPDGNGMRGYALCDSIGGIGLMRTSAFTSRPPLRPTCTYSGFTSWQIDHKLVCGWVVPSLRCFLLDRLPHSPWIDLGAEYERRGWQRAWGRYPVSASKIWDWWQPVGRDVTK